MLLLQSYKYRNLSEGAGQVRGDKECPFSGVTKSGRVWRKVPESDARSVRGLRRRKNQLSVLLRNYRRRTDCCGRLSEVSGTEQGDPCAAVRAGSPPDTGP